MSDPRVLVPNYMQEQFSLPEFIPLSDAMVLIGKKSAYGYICIDRIRNPNHEYCGELRLNCQ